MRKTFTIIFVFIFSFLSAQEDQQISKPYFSPVITLGYTFGSGWTYGVDLTVGLMTLQNNIPPSYLAGSIQYYFVNYKNETHRIISFNAVNENGYYRLSGGIGIVSKKWGYKNVNNDWALGFSSEVDLSYNDTRVPWLGVRMFLPVMSWPWIKQPYYVSGVIFWRTEPWQPF